jgi:hypothetical protein
VTQPAAPSRTLPALTWAVLVACVTGNTVASFAGAPTAVYVVLGLVTALCVAALTAVHLRARR